MLYSVIVSLAADNVLHRQCRFILKIRNNRRCLEQCLAQSKCSVMVIITMNNWKYALIPSSELSLEAFCFCSWIIGPDVNWKSCIIPNMSNTHLVCVSLFGTDVSGWAFLLDERERASSTSLYCMQEISSITSVEVNYNNVESSFRFLFFHSVVTVYTVAFIPLSLSLYYCILFCLW